MVFESKSINELIEIAKDFPDCTSCIGELYYYGVNCDKGIYFLELHLK